MRAVERSAVSTPRRSKLKQPPSENFGRRLFSYVAIRIATMGVLSDLVLADRKDAERVGNSINPVAEFGGLEAKGIDGILLGELYCILDGSPRTEDFVVDYMGDVLYQASEHGPWVQEVPQELIEWLALVDDDQLRTVGQKWDECEEMVFNYGPPVPDASLSFLREFAALARQALAESKSILLWTCL